MFTEPATPQFAAGKIERVIGTATVTRPEGILFQIKVGDPVFQGDVIETTADGWVSIRFYDGMVFNLSSSARIALKNFPDGGTSQPAVFDVARGDFIFSSGKMAKAGRLEINTPVASIRGRTQFGGIGTLSLISLFFAALEKVQASPSNTTYTDDELLPLDYTSEPHGSFELVTKETVPRHFFVADPGVTWSFRLSSSSELSVSQIANSPARMEQLHAIQQNVLQTYSVGLQAMQGPTVHGPNGSTTNPNFEALPGGARPINFQPDSESAQSLTTASLGVTNSSSGASKTSGATTPVSDSSATSLTLDSIFVPPALPPLAPPSAPPAPVITTTAPAQNSASSIDIAGIAKVNSTVTLFNNGSTVGTATADSGGHWSVPGVALSSGLDYTFTATATDATGTSAPSTALSFHDSQAALATVTALSADTGTAGDFITSVAAQTVSGSYSGTLGAGEKIQVSVDGTTWIDATAGAGTWSAIGVTLVAGAGTLSVRSIDTAGNTAAGSGHSYTLDQTAPSAVATVTALSADTGTAGDFITSVAAQTVSGSYTGTLGAGEKIQVSVNGITWIDATAGAGAWSASGVTLVAGGTLSVRSIDAANNITAGNGHSYTLDQTAPSAVATVLALSADTGTAGDFITSVAAQTVSGSYSGTLTAGEKIQVSVDGSTWIDATAAAGAWMASGVTLAAGAGTLSVRSIDAANNMTAGSGHGYTLDSVAPFIIKTATVNVLTNAGYDLSTLYADMHDGDPTVGVRDSTHFTSPNIGAGVVFNVIGTGLTYNISGGNFDILSGTITALEIRNLSNNNLLVSMTGLSLSAPDFDTAVGAYPVTTSLDSLFKTIAYTFTGGSGPDVAVGGNLNDTFMGGDGNDTLIGGAGLDRALYTTGPIKVDMAAGTVSGAGVGIDTLVSVESIRGTAFDDTYVATGYAGASAIGSVPAGYNEFEGMAGDDVITGNGNTRLSYLNASDAVTVDLASPTAGVPGSTGTAFGTAPGDVAHVGTDIIFGGVNFVRGSEFDDRLLGSNNFVGPEVFQGGGGNDFIDGRGGFDRVAYASRADTDVTGGITVNLAAGTVVGDASVGSDTLRSIEAVRATKFADSYNAAGFTTTNINGPNFGSAGFFVISGVQQALNEFEGLGGDDNITGNGNTRISYVNASDGVTVDLALPTVGVPGSTGIAHGSAPGDLAGIGTDTIFGGVNSIVGSSFADTLSGSNNGFSSSEVFDGGAGNDTFDGRGGFDQAVYNFDLGTAVGITVNMASVNTAVGTVVGDASIGTDTLTSIESVRGTNFADTYVATGYNGASADIPNGTTFNEFEGLGGNDTITGNGNTRISYVSATDGVTVDLAAGTASGNASVGTDMFTGVTRARGSSFTDMILGDSSNNVLDGQGGNDVLDGRSGSDTLIGGGGSDQFFYSAGTDTITDFDQSAGSFNHAEGDVIDLVGSGVTNWTQLQLIMSQNGADTLINFGGGNTMTLSNVTLSNLTQNDFTFSAPISGDLAVSVNNGGIIVLTPSDLHAVDPNSTTGQLTFTVSVPTHGYIAFAANPGIAITSFTEADLEAGHVLFVHDGSNTNTAQATFKVSVSDGITSSAATTIIASVPAVTIQVLTANGMDFNDGDPIKPMGAGQLQPTLTPATQITIINTAANLKFVFEGVGLTLNNDSSPTAITGGTITAIHAFTNDLTPVALYDIAVNVAAVTWYNAIVADAAGNSSLFDTLTNGWSINFVGGAGPDEAASTDSNDFFRSSGGSDFFDGQFGIDRADYTHAPGAINVQLADGTVTKFTDGNATLIDDIDTLRSVELITGTNFVDFFNAGPTANNPSGFSGNSTNAGSPTGSNSGTFNEFQGRGGNDSIIGNGSTRISYMGATAGVTVDFAAQTLSSASVFGPAGTVVGHSFGTAPGDLAGVGTDTFVGVNSVRGSYFDDFLFGSNNPFNTFENFEGRGGNDSIDGRGGFDRAVYANEDFHIIVQLAAGIVTGGLNTGTDILHSIEAIAGTDFDDTYDATAFTGSGAASPSPNSGNSGPGGASSDFNEFEGRGGDDSITGNGNTRVAFYNATAGVTVTLGANGSGASFGTAPDNPAGLATNPIDLAGVGNDIFVSGVSRVRGSEFGDVITGNGGNNTLEGQGGADILNGRGGNDTLTGGTGSDIFVYNNNVTNGNSPPSNNDTITDFNDSEADRIDLRGVSGINTFADVLAHVPIGSPNAIQVDASDSLTLNVPISSLQASDFIFTGQVAMTVQTSDGYNFSTLYDDMAGSIGAISVMDSSHFTATNSTRGLVFSMTVSGDTTPGNPLTGTVNAIDIYDLTGHIQATSNGWNFLASDLNNALQSYAANHSLTSGLDAIFSTVSYNAVGNFVGNNQFNNSSVNFGGDTFVSGAGNDVFNGLTNANGDFNNGDTVDYSDALAGVTVSLLSPGTPQPTGGAGTDTLINIENLRGSSHNDTLTSNGFNSVLEGGPGNDTLIGQVGGSETVSYEHATGPVTVNLLVTAPQNTIGAGTDTISNFEAVRGSAFNDTLTGNGNSVLEGGPGADQLIGQFLGSDTASYQHATASVTVNLLNSALNAGDAAGDTFVFISNVQGSQFNDTLIGDNNNNVLNGWGTHDNGGDVLTGNGGADNFVFSGGRVTVTDFHHADGDKIDLSNLNFGAGVTDTELQALVTAAPDPHTLDLGNGQVLTVSNVAVSTLQSSDFILHH